MGSSGVVMGMAERILQPNQQGAILLGQDGAGVQHDPFVVDAGEDGWVHPAQAQSVFVEGC